MTLHTLTQIILIAIPLAALLMAIAAVAEAYIPIPRDQFIRVCDDAPPVQPVPTKERNHE